MDGPRFTKRALKRAILRLHAAHQRGNHEHKMSVLGRAFAGGQGLLDLQLGNLTLEERGIAGRAYDELRDGGLIAPSYHDMTAPEDWCVITPRGRALLDRGLLDELDEALSRYDSGLVDLRDGAHDAMRSTGADAPRQAAHSAKDLLDQVLRAGARDDDVKTQGWWRPVDDAKSGITRAHRVRLIVERQGRSDHKQVAARITSAGDDLDALRHQRGSTAGLSAVDAVTMAELALKLLLLGKPDPSES
jgi:hypothetical protein